MTKVKNLLLAATAFLLFSSVSPNPQAGIQFSHSKLSIAKAEAKKLNKPIFIDGYTVWCGPCKRMAAQVFTKPTVGNYFNEHFVNLKMDMEKTDGLLVSRRYNVNFYPTLLFIMPDGRLIRKEEGYHNEQQLMKLARDVVKNQ